MSSIMTNTVRDSHPHEAQSQLSDVVLDVLCSGSFVREWESAMCPVEEMRLSTHK